MSYITEENMVTFLRAIEDRPNQDVLSHELKFSTRMMYEVFESAENKKFIKGGSNTKTSKRGEFSYKTYTSDVRIEPRGKNYLKNHS